MTSKYGFNPDDRFIQNADYSFDFSVAEIFLSFASGGCLYCTPKSQCMTPARFVSEHKITVWTSSPSNFLTIAIPAKPPPIITTLGKFVLGIFISLILLDNRDLEYVKLQFNVQYPFLIINPRFKGFYPNLSFLLLCLKK